MIKYDKRKFDAYQIPGVDIAKFPEKQSLRSRLKAKIYRKKK